MTGYFADFGVLVPICSLMRALTANFTRPQERLRILFVKVSIKTIL
jgi:hypothetical protein